MIGWCYKTFKFSFRLNKFIFGSFRSRMRAPHPSRKKKYGKQKVLEKSAGKKSKAGQDLFRSRDVVTSGEKAPLGRILRNFGLCRTYFRTGPLPVTFGHVTSCHFWSLPVKHAQWSDPLDPPQMWLELCPYTTVINRRTDKRRRIK
jgi:hypothetical protein